MARIRTIKPGFFKNDELYELEIETGLPCRVAYAGLWTVADREGRFKWEPRRMKLDCLPYDEVDFSRVLDALATRGFVVRYEVSGREYGFIPTFKEHQIVNNKESPSVLPEPTENGGNTGDLTRCPRVKHALTTPLNQDSGEQEQEQEQEHNPLTPLAIAEAQDDDSIRSIDQIRRAVWRQSGLTEDQITSKLVSANPEGLRQARIWLENFPLDEILSTVTEVYDGAEGRGDAIRRPWVYLARVFETRLEEKNAPKTVAAGSNQWDYRRNIIEKGIWLDNYGARPGDVSCDAPQWAQELFLANKHKRERVS